MFHTYSIFLRKALFVLVLLLIGPPMWLCAQSPVFMLRADSLAQYPQGYPLHHQNWALNQLRTLHPNFGVRTAPPEWKGSGRFTCRFLVDSSLRGRLLALRINHDGASVIYLDGREIGRIGQMDAGQQLRVPQRSPWNLFPFTINDMQPHELQLLYANNKAYFPEFTGFQVWVDTYEHLSATQLQRLQYNDGLLFSVGAQVALVFLHIFLYIFYPWQRLNLYYSIFVGLCAATLYLRYFVANTLSPPYQYLAATVFDIAMILAIFFAAVLLYSVSYGKLPLRRIWVLGIIGVLVLVYYLGNFPELPVEPTDLYFLIAIADGLWALVRAIRRGAKKMWLIGAGMFIVALFFFGVGADLLGWMHGDVARINQWMSIGLLAFPLTFSIYLALDFADTNRNLRLRLEEVGALSERSRQQEAEKLSLITEQARHLEITVAERTREVREQAEQLREMDEVKSRFVVNLTHELRTPLSLIMGPAEQLYTYATTPEEKKNAALITSNAEKLLRLINQLLDLSKLEAGKMELKKEPTDIIQLIQKTIAAFDGLSVQTQVDIRFSSEEVSIVTLTDAGKLEMILHNLLSNAVKFSPAHSRVLLSARMEWEAGQSFLHISVYDKGMGIPAHQLPYVFDRFYQADASDRRSHEGSGVGLALTKELVDLLGGNITIQSQPGWGTAVKVMLPLENISYEPSLPDAQLREEVGELPVVLVIEDHRELRDFIARLLSGMFRVITAAAGTEGLVAATQQIPDLVITDLMMPGMDGYQVCAQLKEQTLTSHIPVIMLTAKTAVESKTDGWRAGADGYLTKPFHQKELLALAENLIAGRKRLFEQYQREDAWATAREALPSREQLFIDQVRNVIEAHLADDQFNVDLLAQAVNLSRAQLHRKLKGSIGQSPGDLIRVVRLQHALQLLKAGTATVSEIAYEVGFNSPASFSTSFSAHFGYPPSAARK
ncbi:Signal transduction histidine kinase [Chitinophaga costaii]|uniref:histidine kinase n=1 Tax=Chitinophaga costaii TaxID=1335309 RepID=A0A1C4G5B5_9BACT|nr:response regulator [Chitinophaga costaii]PUZ19691.1 hypothetical protein DCM91_20200 [Chitinophaga costaii]SCC63360.1 Signal transduction histidine kinase [Chitinophaga costaii]